ncbi:MBL fold metallo-hydrolase [Corynebacterium sp. Q4381]|uniref:MBL fold metallo-hydrolase n=1 Tax=Corynebacterium sp. Marseille-Q4381 TaxID=3121597 RepID=UPI002FE53B53
MNIAGFVVGPYQTNCYVVINDQTREGFAVDPGLGAGEHVRRQFEEQGATLTAVVCTHGHLDHVRDAAGLGVDVYMHPDDAFMLAGETSVPSAGRAAFNASRMETPARVIDIVDGEALQLAGMELSVRHAPGHSPGCVLLVGKELVFSGDVLFNGSVGRTDLEFSDPDAMAQSLRGPVWELDDALTVLPGHGPATTIGAERASNPYLRAANRGR